MTEAPDFSAYALKHKLDDDVFPHAKTGLALYRSFKRLFWFGVLFFLVGWGIRFLGSLIPDAEALVVEGETFNTDQWAASTRGFITGMGAFIQGIGVLLWIIMAVVVVIYMGNTVLRWRAWERHCLINDFRSESLRKGILRTLNVKKYRAEVKKGIAEKRKADNATISRSEEARLDAYNVVRKLQVYVNTRQSLDFEGVVIRYYRIVVQRPVEEDTAEQVDSLIGNLSNAASRVGRAKFGQAVKSDDDRQVMFTDRKRVKDHYKRKPRKQKGESASETFEYAYSLDCLIDNTKKIDSVTQRAQRWAEQRADDLDDLLFTQDVQGRRLRTVVGSSTATVVYDMSFSMDFSQFDTMSKNIDKAFKMDGTAITVDSGELLVTIPLPPDRRLPIDIKTLYSSVFGDPKPMKSRA